MCTFDSKNRNSVLVVDDEEWNVSSLIDNLRDHVYVEYVSDPESALELLAEENQFSAIISDLNMDSMSGYEFLHFLKGNYTPLAGLSGGFRNLKNLDVHLPYNIIKSKKAYHSFVNSFNSTDLVLFCGQSYQGMNLKFPEEVYIFQKEMGVEGRILDHLFDVGVIKTSEMEERSIYESEKEIDFLQSICDFDEFTDM